MKRNSRDETFRTLEFRDNTLILLDQRKLPLQVSYYTAIDYRDVEFAIRDMVVRGAPAIGAAAAYGFYLAALELSSVGSTTDSAGFTDSGGFTGSGGSSSSEASGSREAVADNTAFITALSEASEFLHRARPTAVNLHWALQRMMRTAERHFSLPAPQFLEILLQEAETIHAEDIRTNKQMAAAGSSIIPGKAVILTHCNTGALATAGWGTALGIIKEAHFSGKDIFVYADETRPRLQGARLTAWELVQAGIPAKLIADSTAATLIRDGQIDCVILGADRIAANGDVCNKIGTFMLSVLCRTYNVPFYSAAPISTIDFSIRTGKDIPIEERNPEEITFIDGKRIAAEGIGVYNPAFDVTPHENITGIITERGIITAPYTESIEAVRISMEQEAEAENSSRNSRPSRNEELNL